MAPAEVLGDAVYQLMIHMPLIRKDCKALLVLEDGSVFDGFVFAGTGEALGEVVFLQE